MQCQIRAGRTAAPNGKRLGPHTPARQNKSHKRANDSRKIKPKSAVPTGTSPAQGWTWERRTSTRTPGNTTNRSGSLGPDPPHDSAPAGRPGLDFSRLAGAPFDQISGQLSPGGLARISALCSDMYPVLGRLYEGTPNGAKYGIDTTRGWPFCSGALDRRNDCQVSAARSKWQKAVKILDVFVGLETAALPPQVQPPPFPNVDVLRLTLESPDAGQGGT